jgi:hypothetical protein
MLIGIDFDNTIVSYDQVFYQVALEKDLIPVDIPVSKGKVRDYLRECDREDEWTELQGYVYGARMEEASPFPDSLQCIANLLKEGFAVNIVSHKTRYPYRGPQYDLHNSAQNWLEKQGFFKKSGIGLAPDQVFFELTKQDKIDRIAKVGCTYFIDDLPEFLAEPSFPKDVEPVLFDPNGIHETEQQFRRIFSWKEIEALFLKGGGLKREG